MVALEAPIAETPGLESLFSEDAFCPCEPASLEETGVSRVFVEALLEKLLLQLGGATGRELAKRTCLPFRLVEPLLESMRSRQIAFHRGQAALNDYQYALTDQGRERVADLTNPDPVVTAAIEKQGRSGVPLYLYYNGGAEPEILPQILTVERVAQTLEQAG
ncbi:MAG: hypothetical protein AAF449_23385 [Myxococcota bacterium]